MNAIKLSNNLLIGGWGVLIVALFLSPAVDLLRGDPIHWGVSLLFTGIGLCLLLFALVLRKG